MVFNLYEKKEKLSVDNRFNLERLDRFYFFNVHNIPGEVFMEIGKFGKT